MHQENVKGYGEEDQQQPFGPAALKEGFIDGGVGPGHALLKKHDGAKGNDGADQFKGGDILIEDGLQFFQERDKRQTEQGGVVCEQQQAEMKKDRRGKYEKESRIEVNVASVADPLGPEQPTIQYP